MAEERGAVVGLEVPQLDLAVGGAREEGVAVDVQAAHLVAGWRQVSREGGSGWEEGGACCCGCAGSAPRAGCLGVITR